MAGILAVWNDCKPDRLEEYEAWYQQEHLPGRVSLPGFRVGRRFQALAARRRFLTTYEVDHPDVLLKSEAYRQLFCNPDARTIAMMQNGFHNACRTVCLRHDIQGAVRGAIVVTAAIAAHGCDDALAASAALCRPTSTMVHSERWRTAETGEGALSAEEMLRGGDAKISRCLMLEFLRAAPAMAAADRLRADFPSAEIGIYQLLCTLRAGDDAV